MFDYPECKVGYFAGGMPIVAVRVNLLILDEEKGTS